MLVRVDPKNKCFIAIFCIVIFGSVGFLIATIFIKFSNEGSGNFDDFEIKFSRSKTLVKLRSHASDDYVDDDKGRGRYVLEIYNDDKLLQDIQLGSNLGDSSSIRVIHDSDDVWIIRAASGDEISFIIETNSENFQSIYVKRKLIRTESIVDCLDLKSDEVNWYGGPEQMDQRYPIQKFEFHDYAYITKELESAAIMERYWLSSRGFFILIDSQAPLFIDQNGEKSKGRICFTGKKVLPYDIYLDEFEFNYRIGLGSDAREAHLNVVTNFLGKPRATPDERLIQYPIWNTWVRHGRSINESTIWNFADEIQSNGFNFSLIDIDDFWEDCYGSLKVNQTKFPNLKALTTDLHSRGFVVGMWVHPFVNKDCREYYDYGIANNLFVKSHSGSIDTSWWNSGKNAAAHVDFTKTEGRTWYKSRLEKIQEDFGIDIFKFDGGETSWYPEDPVLQGDPNITPSQSTRAFVEMASEFGELLEIRTGWGTQYLPVLVRMLDFDSRWTAFNGLKSLIPTLLQFNLNGYVFVLPDMIGGNQYNDDVITEELFIRWLQASVFMPSLQFSVAPWDFDNSEVIEIAKHYTELHFEYSELIMERFEFAVEEGHPVNPPIWWLDPTDPVAQLVDDEFLLGETVLAAPVIEQYKNERDIYLPAGKWRDGRTGKTYEGKNWIKNYPAPLDVLPYFIRED